MGALGNNGNSSGSIRFAAFELDIATGELRKHGRSIRLQPQPSRVLAALVSRPGELVSRQELRHQIWDGATFVDFEQGLNFCIRQIRLVLNDDAICRSLCFVNWTFDGKFMYVHFLGTSQTNDLGRSFVVPVQPGNLLPRLPVSGVERNQAVWPGVKVIEGGVFPGPNASVYAFTKQSVHRNLYRIPAL